MYIHLELCTKCPIRHIQLVHCTLLKLQLSVFTGYTHGVPQFWNAPHNIACGKSWWPKTYNTLHMAWQFLICRRFVNSQWWDSHNIHLETQARFLRCTRQFSNFSKRNTIREAPLLSACWTFHTTITIIWPNKDIFFKERSVKIMEKCSNNMRLCLMFS